MAARKATPAAAKKAAPASSAAGKKTTTRKATTAKKAPAAAKGNGTGKGNGAGEADDFRVEDMEQPVQDAFCLSRAAIMLDQARSTRSKKKLSDALVHNLELWTAFKGVTVPSIRGMSDETRDNLNRLSDFITGAICAHGANMPKETIEAIININLQISEGLLESRTAQKIRQRAYEIWEENGRPHGEDTSHWLQAEAEIRGTGPF